MPNMGSRIQKKLTSPTSVKTTSWQKGGLARAQKEPAMLGLNEKAFLTGAKVKSSGGDGEWTKWMQYDEEFRALTVWFKSGHEEIYMNVSPEMAMAAYRGVTAKDGRANSTGAWLHQNLIGQFKV